MVKHFEARLDAAFHALADPTRRRLLHRLAHAPARVTDLAAPMAMSLAAVSKHLKVLEQAGLVERTKLGREFHLTLDPRPLRTAFDWLETYRQFWSGSLDQLADFLEAENQTPTEKPQKPRRNKQ